MGVAVRTGFPRLGEAPALPAATCSLSQRGAAGLSRDCGPGHPPGRPSRPRLHPGAAASALASHLCAPHRLRGASSMAHSVSPAAEPAPPVCGVEQQSRRPRSTLLPPRAPTVQSRRTHILHPSMPLLVARGPWVTHDLGQPPSPFQGSAGVLGKRYIPTTARH